MVLDPRFAAGRRRCAFGSANLPLAASRRLGHIERAGDVAEWLKAAVC